MNVVNLASVRYRIAIVSIVVFGLLPYGRAALGQTEPISLQAPVARAADGARTSDIATAKAVSNAFRAAADAVLPAVVAIENRPKTNQVEEGSQTSPFGGENPFEGTPFEDFFNQNSPFGHNFPKMHPNEVVVGIGSGVIIDPSGIILTNNHVIDGGGEVTVRLQDGREFKATDVKADAKTDLAIVRIDAADLTAAPFGDSSEVQVGDWVLALGQPFGLTSTVTAGIISATHRDIGINNRENFFQTDAAINPGNSGGPLVNLNGQIIGINTAITTRSGGNEGIGFAVPSNLAHWVTDQLIKYGKVQRAYLGVGIQPVTQQLAGQFGVPAGKGVVVTQIFPDSPAAKAGVKSGDVITKFDGTTVTSAQELQQLVEKTKPDSSHELTIVRDGSTQTLAFTPQPEPENYGVATTRHHGPTGQPPSEGVEALGIAIGDLTPDLAKQLDLNQTTGAVITEVERGSIAAQAGLEPGMVIAEVNHQPVATAAEAKKALESASLDKGVLLLLKTNEGSLYVVLESNQ